MLRVGWALHGSASLIGTGRYNAHFVVYNSIILEAKAVNAIIDDFIKVTLNYLRVSKLNLGLIANFGEPSFKYKRVIFDSRLNPA